ncbi:hypothetical protein [Roseiarcus sp.]|uniref:hypothetical protein n=1 Tax=Roseiarcus sp. TaxID=1969460 RepID=UPI003F968B07
MSRGHGHLQNFVQAMISRAGKPMTFEDMRAAILESAGTPPTAKLLPARERSLRRAVQRLTDDSVLIAIGDGGRGDPFRYFIHPVIIGMISHDDPERGRALEAALTADAGSNAAAAKFMAKMFPP